MAGIAAVVNVDEELSPRGVGLKMGASRPTIVRRDEYIALDIVHEGITITRAWSTRFSKTNLPGKLINQITFFLASTLQVLWTERDLQICSGAPRKEETRCAPKYRTGHREMKKGI